MNAFQAIIQLCSVLPIKGWQLNDLINIIIGMIFKNITAIKKVHSLYIWY